MSAVVRVHWWEMAALGERRTRWVKCRREERTSTVIRLGLVKVLWLGFNALGVVNRASETHSHTKSEIERGAQSATCRVTWGEKVQFRQGPSIRADGSCMRYHPGIRASRARSWDTEFRHLSVRELQLIAEEKTRTTSTTRFAREQRFVIDGRVQTKQKEDSKNNK